MFAFNKTIGLCVVAGDADVVDAVLFGKGIERGNEWFAVVGHNCLDCAPSAKNILEIKSASVLWFSEWSILASGYEETEQQACTT
jgi:hypothetical protein